jgi:hypothetical protein
MPRAQGWFDLGAPPKRRDAPFVATPSQQSSLSWSCSPTYLPTSREVNLHNSRRRRLGLTRSRLVCRASAKPSLPTASKMMATTKTHHTCQTYCVPTTPKRAVLFLRGSHPTRKSRLWHFPVNRAASMDSMGILTPATERASSAPLNRLAIVAPVGAGQA